MAVFGSNMPSEVGLRLLLCPLGSNVVMRTACCSVGIVLPVYSTFKAIESKEEDEQHKWLVYWAAYGSFTVAELFTDKFLYWYYFEPNVFVPSPLGGKAIVYEPPRPFLLRHQSRLDQLVGFFYGEMVTTFLEPSSTNHVVQDIIHPGQRQVNGSAIEGSPPPGGWRLQNQKMKNDISCEQKILRIS
ncbi:hypothetical protein DH2020_006753 [Rehmannia glutinosa]|uniref:HVA22-like protein n=1 Tax=Rehmannia glutinosa TaxID=99300 RepID=A0ABR0XJS1_REHGL